MTVETQKTQIVVNGVSVPGILFDGAFISYSPIETRLLYRSGAFTANTGKTFTIECPSLVETILFFDTNNNTVYNFAFLTPEGISYNASFNNSNYTSLGNTKTINSPRYVLEKGTKVTITPDKAVQGIALFCRPAYNIDIKNF
jgi:hypothetical protein